MCETIEIRRAELADIPGCAAVVNKWIDETQWMPRAHPSEDIERLIREALPVREIYVVGHPVEAYLSFDPVSSKIGALFCRQTGRGVGKALLDHVRKGRDFLWLTSDEPNDRAQSFYRREGFVECGFIEPEPPETLREVRMEWCG
ncbi:MAG: GNAT family N-acetyltransferase [Paracoccaceae bacterium]